jgi:Mg-chelatase subunit ChlD
MKARQLLSAALMLSVVPVWAWAQEAPATAVVERPRVEVVFVLDTTGSMSGLIAAAKEKIWAIANTLASAKPVPEIRMGLVGYRDRGDAYVTKVVDLSDDLDLVYAELTKFQADGGGDTPESVNQALHEAVTKISWSEDARTYRTIFLVGDCPPHMDYQDDVKYPEVCKAAATTGICINTIQCGNHGDTTPIWREIADKSDGQCFQVDQSGGAVLAATPYDEELAKLSREMAGTRLLYGTAEEMKMMAEREEAVAGAVAVASDATLARRASFAAGPAAEPSRAAGKDIVAEVSGGRVKLADIDADELPDALKNLSPAEREARIAELAKQRAELQAKIEELSKKRQAHLEEELRKMNLDETKTFDFAIYRCISEQAKDVGLSLEEGPAL